MKFSKIMMNEINKDREHVNPLWVQIGDKIQVEKFVNDRIGKNNLFKHRLYSGYDIDEAIRNIRPPCVMKMSNAWRRMKFFENKNYNEAEIKTKFTEWADNVGVCWEPHYKLMRPGYVVEKSIPSPHILIKFLVFGGRVQYVWMQLWTINYSRPTMIGNTTYTRNYERINVRYNDHPNPNIRRPKKLDKMIEIAEKLAQDLKYLRVDLYYNDDMLFSEATHEFGGGTTGYPEWFDIEMGEKLMEAWK